MPLLKMLTAGIKGIHALNKQHNTTSAETMDHFGGNWSVSYCAEKATREKSA
jgi:hypothetical protein